MKNLIALILISACFVGCAKSEDDVICKVYFEFDSTGHRVNAFWDIKRNHKVDVKDCTEILTVGEEHNYEKQSE